MKRKIKRGRPYIAYYRVSTGKQGIRGLGISAQKTAVKNYLKQKKRKFPPAYSFTEQESGKKSHRPKLIEALDLTYDLDGILIVAKLDRLSRDLHFITAIQKAKIDFVCCDMPQADRLTINLIGTLAQWEREQISKRTKGALAELKKKGRRLGWNNPKVRKGIKTYWKAYKKAHPKKEKIKKIKKEKEAFVSQADKFAESLRGTFMLLLERDFTLKQMAQKLTKMPVKTRQGNKNWSITQVVRVLKRLGLE